MSTETITADDPGPLAPCATCHARTTRRRGPDGAPRCAECTMAARRVPCALCGAPAAPPGCRRCARVLDAVTGVL